ncbi:hypothetical protein EVAR_47410_1 [Eumeta japonica]|uniref:Uncharacterized protein n=1 Tax=Eumeta variegata TaxID=151549 RepID=A0A4C1Y3Z9_EUMVA|nr:hypothetical protein EVAR_47410_1 [Eumeta japonica]
MSLVLKPLWIEHKLFLTRLGRVVEASCTDVAAAGPAATRRRLRRVTRTMTSFVLTRKHPLDGRQAVAVVVRRRRGSGARAPPLTGTRALTCPSHRHRPMAVKETAV